MNKEDSETHDMSSPKHSYHARRKASTTQSGRKPSPVVPHQVKRVIASSTEEVEKFDLPLQYY